MFAVLTATAAAGVIVALVAGAGLFFNRAPAPGHMLLSDLVAHLGYAFPLMLGLELAGVRTARTRRVVVVEALRRELRRLKPGTVRLGPGTGRSAG